MRPALLTPMRLLIGIAALTVLCMLAVAAVTDHLADKYLFRSTFTPSSRVHLINGVIQALKRAEDCRRAYLLTGENSNLIAYRAACSDVDSSMNRLLTNDHEVTSKLAHAESLEEFVHAKLSEIEKALESSPVIKAPAAIPAVDGDLARIQNLLYSLAREESQDMSDAREALEARAVFHQNLVIALAVINIIFLGSVAFCASQIGKLYSLITVCAWSKRVQYQGKWVPLEEYMSNRFGVRISHGISKDEYDKWMASELAGELLAPSPFLANSPPVEAAYRRHFPLKSWLARMILRRGSI